MRRDALICVALLLAITIGCHGAATESPAPVGAAASTVPAVTSAPPGREPGESGAADLSARRDLQVDEALGGHTLSRHVGRTDDELAERLRREHDISAASTYTDRASAERVVAQAIEQAHGRIEAWTHRQGSRPNLVLHYTQRDMPPFGRSLSRGAAAPRPCDSALVVLRWDERHRRWFVLTSYPELGR